MPGRAGTSWCPAVPSLSQQHSSPHFQALLLLLFQIRRITTEGQWGRKKRNRSKFGTLHHIYGQSCVSRLPHVCWSEPLSHGREQPLGAHGEHVRSTSICPHQVLVALHPPVQALSSTPAASHYTMVNSPNTECSPRECQFIAPLLPGPWKKECLLLHFTCSSPAQGTGHI